MAAHVNLSFEYGLGTPDGWTLTASSPGEMAGYSKAWRNYLLWSEAFDDASWTKIACTVNADQTAGPATGDFPGILADELVGPGVSGTHRLEQLVSGLSDTEYYRLSVYAKQATEDFVALQILGAANYEAWFDLANGAVGSNNGGGTATVEDAGGGWYRCSLIARPLASTATCAIYVCKIDAAFGYVGTNESIYCVGAQMCEENVRDYYRSDDLAGGGVAGDDDFENSWGTDEYYSAWSDLPSAPLAPEAAEYDYGDPAGALAEHEAFESEWGNAVYLTSWTAGVAASYDAGTPESVEDFEEEWDSNESYVTTFPAGTAALYDVRMDPYEDFEEEWTIVL